MLVYSCDAVTNCKVHTVGLGVKFVFFLVGYVGVVEASVKAVGHLFKSTDAVADVF